MFETAKNFNFDPGVRQYVRAKVYTEGIHRMFRQASHIIYLVSRRPIFSDRNVCSKTTAEPSGRG